MVFSVNFCEEKEKSHPQKKEWKKRKKNENMRPYCFLIVEVFFSLVDWNNEL